MNSYVTPTLCALNAWMQAIPTSVMSVCSMVCLCVGHSRETCRNGGASQMPFGM